MEEDEMVECNTCGCIMSYVPKWGVHACFNSECTSAVEPSDLEDEDFIEEE